MTLMGRQRNGLSSSFGAMASLPSDAMWRKTTGTKGEAGSTLHRSISCPVQAGIIRGKGPRTPKKGGARPVANPACAGAVTKGIPLCDRAGTCGVCDWAGPPPSWGFGVLFPSLLPTEQLPPYQMEGMKERNALNGLLMCHCCCVC